MQTNVIAQSIGLLHARFQQERQKRWIFHCLSKEAHRAAVVLDSGNETDKTIVLNPVRSYAPGNLEDLVQIDKAQSLIRAMYQIALIEKALNQVIRQFNSLGAYRHVQMMTVEPKEPTLQAWLPPKEPQDPPQEPLPLIPEAQLLHEQLFASETSYKNEEEGRGQDHHPGDP
eukprot:14009525-Ditylum_brightwellii.AAC.1